MELSATSSPSREGTSLYVAAHPGVTVWAPPGGERFVRSEVPKARWRALSDVGEERYQASLAAMAEAE